MPEDAQEPGRGHLHPQSKARNLVEQDGSRGLHTFFQLQVDDDAAHRRGPVRAVERAPRARPHHHPPLSLRHRRVMRPHKAVQPFARACVAPDVLGVVVAAAPSMAQLREGQKCLWRVSTPPACLHRSSVDYVSRVTKSSKVFFVTRESEEPSRRRDEFLRDHGSRPG